MLRSITFILGLAVAAGVVAPAIAQLKPDVDHGPARYDHHKLIRVDVRSQRQLDTILAVGAKPWNCVIGLGVQSFSLSPGQLDALRLTGILFTIVNDDLQPLVDAQMASIHRGEMQGGKGGQEQGGIAGGAASWFDDYKTYPAVIAHIDDLVAARPDLISKLTIGTTIEGRTIYGMRITSAQGPVDKPAVLYTGCQHAREWVAVMVPMYIADSLVNEYDSNTQIHSLLDRLEFFIIPVVNPDGYEYTYAPDGDRFWRKNRHDNGGGVFGVDLNRNWGVDWSGPNSTSSDPNSEVYYGTSAFSEPETAAVRDFVQARPQIVAHIDFHSFAQLILQNWAYTNMSAPDVDLIDSIGTEMNRSIFGVNGQFYENGWGGSLLYLASGVAPDWSYGAAGNIAYTIELRDTGQFGFALPPDQIIPTVTEALPAALTLAERISRGADFFFPRGLPPVVITGSATTTTLSIQPIAGTGLDSSSARLHYRFGPGGPFATTALTPLGGNVYQASVPATPCGERVQYYFSIQSTTGATFTSPIDAPASFQQATAVNALLNYNFEVAGGWTTQSFGATTGQWQQGVPVNNANWPYDPLTDADGSGQCFVTQNTGVFSDVSNGSVVLTSPAFDLSAFNNPGPSRPVISYSYYLHLTGADNNDPMLVEISSNGTSGPWVAVANHTLSGGANWQSNAVDPNVLHSLVSYTNNMRLRFTVTDGNPQSIVEAGLDGVRISTDCGSTCPADVAPTGGNGVVNIDDLLVVLNCWGSLGCGDIAPPGGNGITNIDDLLAAINAWGACP